MNTRDALVAAATDLIDEGGPDRVTLREVGRRAGVSHNAPYKHFANKQALLAAVAARELIAVSKGTNGSVRGLRGFIDDYIDWALTHPARHRLVTGEWDVESVELAEAADVVWRLVIDLVSAGMRERRLPDGDPERLAGLIRSLTDGAITLHLSGHLVGRGKGHATPDELVADLFGYLRP